MLNPKLEYHKQEEESIEMIMEAGQEKCNVIR
jgi:hypothetical protein